LAAEIERLHQLVSEVDAEDAVTRYSVNRALEPMLAVSAAGGWPVHWSVPEDLEASGRPAELAQVVHGLLVNATRYAPGSPIDVSARAEHDFVLVHVDDRGPGVDRGMRDSIFERGVQDARHGDRDGHGLGLYIARSMLRSAGGDVWVEPRIGGGSRFVVAVPTGDPMARRVGASPDNVTPFVRPVVSERAVNAQGVGRR
jgi:two-component system OmpR family sensor kinase